MNEIEQLKSFGDLMSHRLAQLKDEIDRINAQNAQAVYDVLTHMHDDLFILTTRLNQLNQAQKNPGGLNHRGSRGNCELRETM